MFNNRKPHLIKKYYDTIAIGTLYKVIKPFTGIKKDQKVISLNPGDFIVYLGTSTITSESLSDVADYKPKFLINEEIVITSSAVLTYQAHFLEKL